jgi:predicted hydrocarbon binding protein
MDIFTFDDMKKINRKRLGNQVPLELFRAIRLIGLYQGLPMGGKGTTVTIGRKIGASMPVRTVNQFFTLFEELKIGIPAILRQEKDGMRIAVEDCFCKGLPVTDGKFVCDLEGSMIEGAFGKIFKNRVVAREVKCNINGDEHCEYEIKFYPLET